MYDTIKYDGSPSLDQFVPEGVWFKLVHKSDTAGLINLKQLNNVTWIPHIFIRKKYRGEYSFIWGQLVIDSMEYNLGAKKFLAFTPYKNAKKYTEKLGFKHVATLSKSIQKDGELLDQYVMEK